MDEDPFAHVLFFEITAHCFIRRDFYVDFSHDRTHDGTGDVPARRFKFIFGANLVSTTSRPLCPLFSTSQHFRPPFATMCHPNFTEWGVSGVRQGVRRLYPRAADVALR